MIDYRFRIGKVYISATNPDKAKEYIITKCLNRDGGYICVSNIRMVRYAGIHSEYARLMEGSLMNLPDGKPLKWIARLWGLKDVETACGPELFKDMLKKNDTGLKHYLLGDTKNVLDKIQSSLYADYNKNNVGGLALPFAEVDEFEYNKIAAQINESGANLVWTAMRSPKQDEFNQRLSKLLPHIVFIGVGRAFRLLTGDVKQAPKWAQKMGIAGIFTRKMSLGKTLWWYFISSFYLAGYAVQICWWRLIGKKCDEL